MEVLVFTPSEHIDCLIRLVCRASIHVISYRVDRYQLHNMTIPTHFTSFLVPFQACQPYLSEGYDSRKLLKPFKCSLEDAFRSSTHAILLPTLLIRERRSSTIESSTFTLRYLTFFGSTQLIKHHSSASTVLMGSVDLLTPSRHLEAIMPSKGTSSVISKAYKQAQNLFLTRRLSESLQALQPIIALQDSDEEPQESSTSTPRPLIASATKGARIKVWNLFLTLLNSILELEPDERKSQFSSTEWRSLALKARDGSIWEEVVQAGYGGVEGDVDAEVVSNLYKHLLPR